MKHMAEINEVVDSNERPSKKTHVDFPVLFAIPVWGIDYVGMLLEYCLSSLLSSKNIPDVILPDGSALAIITTDADWEIIKNSEVFIDLSKYIEIVFLPKAVPDDPSAVWNRHLYQSACFDVAISYFQDRGVICFFNPDAIYANGAIPSLLSRIKAGKTVVAGWGPRVLDQSSTSHLRDCLQRYRVGSALDLPPREAVRLLLAHNHPDTLRHVHDSDIFPFDPYMCVWFSPSGNGFISHSLSLHPYAIDYRRVKPQKSVFEARHLDAYYIESLGFDDGDIDVVSDSDDLTVLSITSFQISDLMMADRGVPVQNRYFDASIRWKAWASITPVVNRMLFKVGIFFHTEEIDEDWRRWAGDIKNFCAELVSPAARPDLKKYQQYMEIYANRFVIIDLLRRWLWRRVRRHFLLASKLVHSRIYSVFRK